MSKKSAGSNHSGNKQIVTDFKSWENMRTHLENDGQLLCEAVNTYIVWEGNDLEYILETKTPDGHDTDESYPQFYSESGVVGLQERLISIAPFHLWEFM